MKLTLRKYANIAFSMGAILFLALPIIAVKQASAFSLGQIRVTGSPNKEFKAEIPVRIDGKAGLNVRLGDVIDYKRIGVPRPVFLDNLTVEVAPHPIVPNQSIIYITSLDPILAPSFNLVIKASLGGGIILESYFLALDFQQNLSLDIPVTAEERSEMEKIAKELSKLKPGAENDEEEEKPEPEAKPEPEQDEKEMTTIDLIKRQEMEAVREEGGIRSENIIEPAPAPAKDVRPVKVSPPPKPIRKPAPAEPDKVAMIERIRKHQQDQVSKPEPTRSGAKPTAKRAPVRSSAQEGEVIEISVDPAANIYEVKDGDSLYKIVIKLGASSKDYDRVVVALWRNNFKHFINGNIHGLYGGRKLDISSVNETVKNLTRAEAKKIIMDQWPLWQDQTIASASKIEEIHASNGKPLVGIKAPALKLPFKSEILSLLTGWQESFEKGDMAAHMNYYSDKYKSGKMTKSSLSDAKPGYGFGNGKMGVKFDNVKMIQSGDLIEVILPAATSSDKNRASIPRKLYFANENGHYRIVKETGLIAPAATKEKVKTDRPFVVHIASFIKQESALRLVELLRMKGYNAFEVLSFVPGKGSWHRVAVDRFASISDADLFSLSIKSSGLSRYTRTLKLPYAIQIGDSVSLEEIDGKIEKYLSIGFSTYSVSDQLSGKATIFLGAFDSEKSAARALALLGELKDSSSVVRP